jgi:TrmH family RNA methyltransferase
MHTEIVSVHNERVKHWSRLLEKKGRDREQKFIVEGVHLVCEALASDLSVETVAYSKERGIPAEVARWHATAADRVEWIAVSEQVLAKCTDAQTPQPVFAVVAKPRWNEDMLFAARDSLVLVADGVRDPGNVGTMIRSADAVGATGVVLGKGTADPFNPKTVRSTMGSLFRVPVIEADLEPLLIRAKQSGAQLVQASLQANCSCYEADLTKPTWLIVGNEAAGVSPEIARLADLNVVIPMRGSAESLNVAMASTVLMFEAARQRYFSPNKNSCP